MRTMKTFAGAGLALLFTITACGTAEEDANTPLLQDSGISTETTTETLQEPIRTHFTDTDVDRPRASSDSYSPEVIEKALEEGAGASSLDEMEASYQEYLDEQAEEQRRQEEQERIDREAAEREAEIEREREAAEQKEREEREEREAAEREAAEKEAEKQRQEEAEQSESSGGPSSSASITKQEPTAPTQPVSTQGKSAVQVAQEVANRHGCGNYAINTNWTNSQGAVVWYEGGAPQIDPYIYIRSDVSAQGAAWVAAHECAHALQWEAYGGAVDQLYADANAVYGSLQGHGAGMPSRMHGIEGNADCVAQSWGYVATETARYNTECSGAKGTAAQQIANGQRIG